ncbi:MAG: fused MFS/spermidine synthase [Actinomycetota bacterium]|nr:fused MFS/spermidine synthase [Actinomycetota bacterium]
MPTQPVAAVSTAEEQAPSLGPSAAAALVFGSSAAVLVIELVALRLLAPYLGLTLEMSTAVIGVALAAIATGSWLGGRAADVVAPQRMLGPLLLLSGALVALILPAVRWTGEIARGGDVSGVLLMAALTLFAPAALLSAVTPMVTKVRLTSLSATGTVVGRLSGIGTAGAIAGTVATGFGFVSAVPSSVTMLSLGGLLVAVGGLLTVRLRGWRTAAAPVAVALIGGAATVWGPNPCEVETTYHCASVVNDPERSTGRVLVLDTLRHSYVDLADPTYLHFDYVQAIASAADVLWARGEPLSAFHLGGGALTLPRYLHAVRPGTRSLVTEIDPGVLEIAVDRLGLEADGAIVTRTQDARVGLAAQATDSRDLVVADAFSGVAVPWHLATREVVRDAQRVLVDDGVYTANVIDHPPLDFARAQAATIASVFDHVVLATSPATLAGDSGGNVVLIASDAVLDSEGIQAAIDQRGTGYQVLATGEVEDFAGDAAILTDDFAPVDQLLTPYPTL